MESEPEDPKKNMTEEESVRYRVAWRIKATGATANGEYVEKKDADAWLEKQTREHPEMEHWLEPEEKQESLS